LTRGPEEMILVYVRVLYCQRKTELPGWQFSDINKDEQNCFLLWTPREIRSRKSDRQYYGEEKKDMDKQLCKTLHRKPQLE
jgi:hypothetical protein